MEPRARDYLPLPQRLDPRCQDCGEDFRVGWFERDEKNLCSDCVGGRIGWIYVLQGGGELKVGWSSDPWTRIVQLQSTCEHELDFFAWWPGDRGAEYALHELLTPFRARGREWYRDCKEIREVLDFPGIERRLPWRSELVMLTRCLPAELRERLTEQANR